MFFFLCEVDGYQTFDGEEHIQPTIDTCKGQYYSSI